MGQVHMLESFILPRSFPPSHPFHKTHATCKVQIETTFMKVLTKECVTERRLQRWPSELQASRRKAKRLKETAPVQLQGFSFNTNAKTDETKAPKNARNGHSVQRNGGQVPIPFKRMTQNRQQNAKVEKRSSKIDPESRKKTSSGRTLVSKENAKHAKT